MYLAHDENGDYIGGDWLPGYIAEWLEKFVLSGALIHAEDAPGEYCAGGHGVEPFHDPRRSHLSTAEGAAYRASLPEWVDVRKCQFCHPESGCTIPHQYRPPICDEFHCELWSRADLALGEDD